MAGQLAADMFAYCVLTCIKRIDKRDIMIAAKHPRWDQKPK